MLCVLLRDCDRIQTGGINAHRWRYLVVLHADHHLVVHGQSGSLPHRRTNDCAHRFGRGLGRSERYLVRHSRSWIHYDFLSSIIYATITKHYHKRKNFCSNSLCTAIPVFSPLSLLFTTHFIFLLVHFLFF